MKDFTFTKNVEENENYRKSFNQLALQMFNINFESWYKQGFWTENFEPHCYVDKEEVVANVSVNKLKIIINGKKVRAIQLGTVMTHSAYRNRGLSASLLSRVLADYENEYDIMYLFANKNVLEFYPKFGFHAVEEYQFTMDFIPQQAAKIQFRKLNVQEPSDLDFIYRFASSRIPNSRIFGTDTTAELLMFYCMNVFPNHIYYIAQKETIVIFKNQRDELHLYDIISKKEINILSTLNIIASANVSKIIFYFTPNEANKLRMKKPVFQGSEVLFVKTNGISLPAFIKHPITSLA